MHGLTIAALGGAHHTLYFRTEGERAAFLQDYRRLTPRYLLFTEEA